MQIASLVSMRLLSQVQTLLHLERLYNTFFPLLSGGGGKCALIGVDLSLLIRGTPVMPWAAPLHVCLQQTTQLMSLCNTYLFEGKGHSWGFADVMQQAIMLL